MDFTFTAEQESFRQEIRDFLAQEMPSDWCGRSFVWQTEDEWRVARGFDKKLGEKGWLTLPWPKEYGGGDLSPVDQLVFQEEMAYARAPNGGGWAHGPVFVGPTVIHYGSEEQKRRFLPPISTGEEIWCQGFSEPVAGSDLAGLETSALADGDDYVINGMKHLVGQGQRAEWCILAARTDPDAPKHKGVSLLIVDMRLPGVEVELMPTLPRHGAQSRITMKDVRVPKNMLVGERGRGFYQMMTTMDYERNRIAHAVEADRVLDDLYAYATEHGMLRDPVARHRLADRKIEAKVAILLNYRVAWLQGQGQVPNFEASIGKMMTEELRQRVGVTAMQTLGLFCQPILNEPHAAQGGDLNDFFLSTVSSTILGGSSEVQRNIIATRGLGLPR